ncbi:hypothetical protein AGR13a_Cc330056 [Agrobacterium genomosp. 13 str. CFBP 6927]|uniref:Transposase n=1 Tax=Agrobacterium genomosp. 13 str. CFBP 6927 TaxID=1183428 RepID=A0ABP2BHR6_9HYPH|nr:hypothetical protein AGR13a_Cc330056 [Agrobacterium genomosp. 13 str. CFBP 6927]
MYSKVRYLITMLGNPGRSLKQTGFSKHLRWVAPFGDPWIKAYSQLPTAFSQRITSFFACACQGIHQMPLIHFFVLIVYAHP